PLPPAAHLAPLFISSSSCSSDTAILALHDALPIFGGAGENIQVGQRHLIQRRDVVSHWFGERHVCLSRTVMKQGAIGLGEAEHLDRKSTRLNSSHVSISYAVFCLTKNTSGR